MINPRELLQKPYDKASADKDAADKAAADEARTMQELSSIKSVGKGAQTFADIDKWLADNPDEQYFRIENGGDNTKGYSRTYTGKYGTWSDNDAAIVGQDKDKEKRDIFRYANISAADIRTGKRGEKSTVGMQYSPSRFFSDKNIEYKSDYGLVYSRDEYGKLKESAAKAGKSDRFLEAPKKTPELSSDYGKDKSSSMNAGKNTAKLGSDKIDSLSGEDDTNAPKRKILG